MSQPTPFQRISRSLAIVGAIQAPLAFAAGLGALGDPFSDPHGPVSMMIALGYFLLAILCLSALPGFSFAKRPLPHTSAGRLAWSSWVAFAGLSNLVTLPALLFAVYFLISTR